MVARSTTVMVWGVSASASVYLGEAGLSTRSLVTSMPSRRVAAGSGAAVAAEARAAAMARKTRRRAGESGNGRGSDTDMAKPRMVEAGRFGWVCSTS